MPTKNKRLYDALIDFTALKEKNIGEITHILNGILGANPADEGAFRAAVALQADRVVGTHLVDAFKDVEDSGALDFDAHKVQASFLKIDEVDSGFSLIHKLAAEQRVKLGLKNCDPDVLIKILEHNGTELRTYIQGKAPLGDFQNHPPHGWNPANEDVLTLNALQNIKKEAAYQLMIQLVQKGTNLEEITALLIEVDKQHPDLAAAKKAAKNLNFPEQKLALLTEALLKDPAVKANLERTKAMLSFKKFVNEKSTTDLIDPQIPLLLQKNNGDFKAAIRDNPNITLDDTDIEGAKIFLGMKYLAAVIPTKGDNFLPAISAANGPLMEAQLKAVFGDHDYVTKICSKPENIDALRHIMLPNVIKGIVADNPPKKAAVRGLLDAKTLVEFKQHLTTLGIVPPDVWVTAQDWKNQKVQAAIRSRVFELELDKCSPFGGHKQHPKLKEVFNRLSPSQQLSLVGENNTHKVKLLVDATDEARVKFYTGTVDPETDLELIAKENQKIAGLRMIFNSEIAKTLSGLGITLTPEKAGEINKLLLDAYDWNTDLRDFDEYKNLINDIKRLCDPIANENAFYAQFNINPARSGYVTTLGTESSAKIKQQQDHNDLLFDEYSTTPDSPMKKLLGIVMCLEKANDLTVFKGAGTFAEKFTADINNSNDLATFIARYNAQPELQLLLKSELTEQSFKQLQVAAIKAKPVGERVENAKATLNEVAEDRAPYALSRLLPKDTLGKKLISRAAKITPETYNESHLAGIFKEDKEKLIKEYQLITAECAIAIEVLLENEDKIKAVLKTLDENSNDKSEMQVITALKEELRKTQAELKAYKAAKQTYDKSIEKLEKAVVDKGYHAFRHDTMVVRSYNNTPVPDPVYSGNALVAIDKDELIKPSEYRVLEPGKVETVKIYDKDGRTATSTAVVGEYRIKMNTPDTVVSRKGETTKQRAGGLFEVVTMPPVTEPERAAKTSIDMATDIIKQYYLKYGKAPDAEHPIPITGSDKHQVQMIYFALLECGEKNPELRFGKDALLLNTAAFRPGDYTKWHGGYTEESYRNQVFRNKDHPEAKGIVDLEVGELAKWTKAEKLRQKERKDLEKDLQQELRDLREQSKDIRDKTIQRTEAQGAREMTAKDLTTSQGKTP